MGVSTAAAQERTLLDSDVPPVLRQSRVFVPVRVVGTAIGPTVAWNGATETLTLVRGAVTVQLKIGTTSALVNGSPRTLSAALFIRSGRTMVPIRFVSEALGIPVEYDSRTFSLVVGPVSGTLWVLPLSDPESGVDIRTAIVILLPEANSSVSSPVKVHGQANVFEGAVTIEIRDNNDQVIVTGLRRRPDGLLRALHGHDPVLGHRSLARASSSTAIAPVGMVASSSRTRSACACSEHRPVRP